MQNLIPSVEETNPQDYFITDSLYKTYSYTEDSIGYVRNIIYGSDAVDCYCVVCGKPSVFTPYVKVDPFMRPEEFLKHGLTDYYTFKKEFRCPRGDGHILLFSLLVEKGKLIKIGQYPSYADVSIQDIEKFKGILPNSLYLEFKKAVGLYAHGVGAGSLIYLRRIFEQFIIADAYQRAKMDNIDWSEDAYSQSRMGEKIKMLSNYLPVYLVSNPVVYGIVSKGIHELSEQDCLQSFPVLKSFIELVLIDIKNDKEAATTKSRLSSELQNLASKMK